MSTASHWETIYASKDFNEVSWFQSYPAQSIDLIHRSGIPKKASIIDIGGGASSLVEELLKEGFESISVLDISSNALTKTKRRLGEKSKQVRWIIADILTVDLPLQCFDLWHDRAVRWSVCTVSSMAMTRLSDGPTNARSCRWGRTRSLCWASQL